jgi:hypothetical protein
MSQGHLDRLTSIDAGFLHQEDGGAHMHIGGPRRLRRPPPERRRVPRPPGEPARAGAALPPAAGRHALRHGPPAVGRRPRLPHRLPRAPHRAAVSGQPGAAADPDLADHVAAPGPHQAAVGDVARRGPRGRPLGPSCPRPTTR